MIKFLADMGISMRVVEMLREKKHDVVHLREEKLHKLPYTEVFKKAVDEDRTILTFDLDFGEIVALSKGSLVSIILFRLHNTNTPFVLKRLEQLLDESIDNLVKGTVIIVEDTRYRVRRLPIK